MLEVEQAVPPRIDAHLPPFTPRGKRFETTQNHRNWRGYPPEKIPTNADLEQQMIETTGDWIVDGWRRGTPSPPQGDHRDLAYMASRRALEAAGIEARDIDLIVLGTTTPDHVFSSAATQLQHRLAAGPADVQAVCTGFVYAMDIARRFIATGATRRALVVGRIPSPASSTGGIAAPAYHPGDGAGAAVVLEATDEPGIIDSRLHADGRYKELLWVTEPAYPAVTTDSAKRRFRGDAWQRSSSRWRSTPEKSPNKS